MVGRNTTRLESENRELRARIEELESLANANSFASSLDPSKQSSLSPEGESGTLLRLSYEHAPIMMCTLDSERHVLHANRAFTRFKGFTEEELQRGEAGGILGRIHADDHHEDCGLATSCPDCAITRVINEAIATGGIHENVEFRATIFSSGHRQSVALTATVVPVHHNSGIRVLLYLEDVTAKREASDNLTRILNAVAEGLIVIDLETRRVSFNARFRQMFGYQDGMISDAYDGWTALLHHEDRSSALAALDAYIRSRRGTCESEFRMRAANGAFRRIRFTGRLAAQSGDEGPRLLLGSFVDLTQGKKAAPERLSNESRFLDLFDAAAVACAVTRIADNQTLEVNREWEWLTGWTGREIIGHTPLEFGIWEDATQRADLLKILATDGIVRGLRVRIRRKSGELREVLMSAGTFDRAGEPLLFTLAQDITPIRTAEEALRDSETRLQSLIDLAPVGILVHDLDGKHLLSNQALSRILRLTPEQLAEGQCSTRMYLRADGSPMPASEYPIAKAVQEQRPGLETEAGMVLDSGEVVWLQIASASIWGDPALGIVIVSDITARKHAEGLLRSSRERVRDLFLSLMNTREDERRSIAASIHHETGSMAVSVLGSLVAIETELDLPGTPELRARLAASRRMISETVARLKRLAVDLRPLDLDQLGLAPALRAEMSRASANTDIRIFFTDRSGKVVIPPEVQTALFRTAQEAVTNAIRHAGCSNIRVRLTATAAQYSMSVRDDGHGFDSSEAFLRSRTGLGLHVMREMIGQHNGEFLIKTSAEHGTSIVVTVPSNGSH